MSDPAAAAPAPRRSTAPRCSSPRSSRADEPLTFADLAGRRPGSPSPRPPGCSPPLERTGLLERDETGSYVAGRLFWLYAARHDPCEASWSGSPARRWSAIGSGHRRDRQPRRRPRRPRRPGRAGRLHATCSAPATGPQVDVPAHCSALGKVLLRLRRARRCPTGPLERPTPPHRRPTPAALERELARDPHAAAARSRVDELEVGLDRASPPRCTAAARRRRRRARDLGTDPTARGPARRARPTSCTDQAAAALGAARDGRHPQGGRGMTTRRDPPRRCTTRRWSATPRACSS